MLVTAVLLTAVLLTAVAIAGCSPSTNPAPHRSDRSDRSDAARRTTAAARPQVRQVLAQLPECLERRHGLRVSSEDDFFALVDSRLARRADDADAFAAEDRELAGAYADCMRPVEAVREPLREKLRERFVAENSHEIAALRAKLGPTMERLEKRHGVGFSFPTLS